MVMTLALLVYSIAQRLIRARLKQLHESIPNQIKQPTQNPTARWIFQSLQGINCIYVTIDGQKQLIIDRLTELRQKIIALFGGRTAQIYQISLPNGCSM